MRTLMALAIGLSVAGAAPAESPAENTSASPVSAWISVYQTGIAASRRHSDDEALQFFARSWQISDRDEERGLSADAAGQTCRRLGRVTDARQWTERAWQAFSRDPRLVSRLAVTAANLSDLDRSIGDYTSAERNLREVLASPAVDAQTQAFLRNNLADLLREEGREDEARPLFGESIGAASLSSRERASALIGLADIERQQSAWESSISRWNEAIGICRRSQDEAAEAIALRGLGLTWLQSGVVARAEPLLRRSLRIMDANPDTPPEEVASAHSALGELYRAENKLGLAEDEWKRALDIDRPVLGESHPQVAILMEMLSELYSARGEFSEARDYSARALESMSKSFGERSLAVATALTNQAGVEQRARDFDAAARHFETAIQIARAHPEHRSLQTAMAERYARLLKAMHRTREAKALLAESNSWRAAAALAFPVK